MLLTLTEKELATAVRGYLRDRGLNFAGEPVVDFTAGRGSNGLTATVDLDTETMAVLAETINRKAEEKPAEKPVKAAPTEAPAELKREAHVKFGLADKAPATSQQTDTAPVTEESTDDAPATGDLEGTGVAAEGGRPSLFGAQQG